MNPRSPRNPRSLRAQLDAEKARTGELDTAAKELRSQLGAAQDEIQSLRASSAAAQEAAARLATALDDAASRFSLPNPSIEALSERLAEVLAGQEAIESQVARAQEELAAEREVEGQLRAEIEARDAELQNAQAAISENERRTQELSAAQSQLSLAQPTIAALVARLEALVRERTALQAALAGAQTACEQKVAEAEARATQAEAELAESLKRIETLQVEDDAAALVAENLKLATRLETLNSDFDRLRESAAEAKAESDKAIDEAVARVRAELASASAAERERLESQNQLLIKQLETQGKIPLLSPESTAHLMNSFVQRLSGEAGLQVTDGEIKLKVAFGGTGDQGGFVVPTAESPQELKETLHEVIVRFDQQRE